MVVKIKIPYKYISTMQSRLYQFLILFMVYKLDRQIAAKLRQGSKEKFTEKVSNFEFSSKFHIFSTI